MGLRLGHLVAASLGMHAALGAFTFEYAQGYARQGQLEARLLAAYPVPRR